MPKILPPLCLCLLVLATPPAWADREKDKDKDDRPRPTAAEQKEIRDLAGRLGRGRHPALRGQAATALANYGVKAEAAVPALVQALKDADLGVASASAAALGKVGVHSADAVKGLLEALTRGRQDIKPTCAEALGRIGPNAGGAAPALVEALGSDDFDLRREAATALGFLGPRAEAVAPPRLKARLNDDEPRVRVAAATSLARLGDRSPELCDVLVGAVQKSARMPLEVRHAATEALGLLGGAARGAVPTLLALLREPAEINPALPYAEQRQAQHDDLRRAAAVALGRIGDKEAIPALRAAAETDALREAAGEALARLEGE